MSQREWHCIAYLLTICSLTHSTAVSVVHCVDVILLFIHIIVTDLTLWIVYCSLELATM